MASKPKATRSSTRTKTTTQVADPPAPARTTRAVSKTVPAPAKKTTTSRKPLVNRNTSPDAKSSGRDATPKPAPVFKPVSTVSVDFPPDSDREPIKVCYDLMACEASHFLFSIFLLANRRVPCAFCLNNVSGVVLANCSMMHA